MLTMSRDGSGRRYRISRWPRSSMRSRALGVLPRFAQEEARDEGRRDHERPEQAGAAEVGRGLRGRAPERTAEATREERADRGRHREGQEIDRPHRAALDLVRIHFL